MTWETVLKDIKANAAWKGIAYPVPGVAVAVGFGGRVLRSIDQGKTWSKPEYPEQVLWEGSLLTVNFQSVSMCDSLHGVIWGSPNVHLSTSDGGRSWQPYTIDSLAGLVDTSVVWIAHVECVTPTTYLGIAQDFDAMKYRIVRTTDAGKTWIRSALVDPTYKVVFPAGDSLHGFTAGDMRKGSSAQTEARYGFVQRTGDGGVTWERVVMDSSEQSFGVQTVAAADQLHAIAVGQGGKVLRTVDGGDHWSVGPDLYAAFQAITLSGVAYPSPTKAWVVASEGQILKYDGAPAGVADERGKVGGLVLDVFPVPLREVGEIHYTLARRGAVRLGLVDLLGREVATLVDGVQDAGGHAVGVDAAGMAQGVYFLRMQYEGRSIVRRIVVE
jgi:photosystem II stability/assembly factor-like uncharacterized protein